MNCDFQQHFMDQLFINIHLFGIHWMPCLIGAITFFNETKGAQSCWASLIKDIMLFLVKSGVQLNRTCNSFPVFQCYLNDLQFNIIHASYFRDNRHIAYLELISFLFIGTSMSAFHHQNL